MANNVTKVPNAFQQLLSSEKTPTLGLALLAFKSLIDLWKKLLRKYPDMYQAIEDGIEKLEGYTDQANSVPAYTVAMSMFLIFYCSL